MKDLKNFDTQALFRLGRKLRFYKDFPKGANVNFYEIIGPDHVYERTYERGVEDFTYACGTGTGYDHCAQHDAKENIILDDCFLFH